MKKQLIGFSALALSSAVIIGAITMTGSGASVKSAPAAKHMAAEIFTTATAPKAAIPAQKEFTTAELAKFNGKNGAASYIAVDGVVYDVSAFFKGGTHNGVLAGKDQTSAFYSEHSKSKLALAKIVGVMKTNTTAQNPVTPIAPAPTAPKPDVVSSATKPGNVTATTPANTDEVYAELQKLKAQDDELDLKEDALKLAYRQGKISQSDYRAQKSALEAQDDANELREDAPEQKLDNNHDDDHNDKHNDRNDDDHDDRDDD